MVTGEFNAGATLQGTSMSPRGEYLLLHATETRDKCRPDGTLGLYADFTLGLGGGGGGVRGLEVTLTSILYILFVMHARQITEDLKLLQ